MDQAICKNRPGGRKATMSGALAVILCATVMLTSSPGLRAQEQVSEADALAALKRCSQCHGPTLQMSKLDLSTPEGMLKGGEKGPAVIPGNAEASPLYRRIAGLQTPAMPMKPVAPLNAQEIALLKDWIDQGAKWTSSPEPVPTAVPAVSAPTYPGGYKPRVITDQDRQWWAFQKPVRYSATSVSDARWTSNPIDGFVRSMM